MCGGADVSRPVVVVGDTLLDRDVIGSVSRLCPDAIAPVVDVRHEQMRPGGAGLAALLSADSADDVILVTALGSDAGAATLRDAFHTAGIRVVDLGGAGTTAEKVRVRAGGTSVARVDRDGDIEYRRPNAGAAVAELCAAAGAVLVADYGRGVAGLPAVRTALASVLPKVPVVWDPHPRGAPPLAGARLLTPNQSELMHSGEEAGLAVLTAHARTLVEQTQVHSVAVTLGSRGALLAGAEGPPLVIPCPPVDARDTCGAGDCFAATAARALATGSVVSEAVQAAVDAASAFVARGGAAAIGHADGATGVVDPCLTTEELVRSTRRKGGTVVMTGGCFDLLHPGHIALLEAARKLGDCLVVLLNSDRSVRALKGCDRPMQPAVDRAAVLRALACVDAVEEFDTVTPVPVLERLRPDVFVKGGDYALTDIPEVAALAQWGGQVVVVPYLAGRSTTRLIQEAFRHGV